MLGKVVAQKGRSVGLTEIRVVELSFGGMNVALIRVGTGQTVFRECKDRGPSVGGLRPVP